MDDLGSRTELTQFRLDVERIAGESRDALAELLGTARSERLRQELDVGPAVPQGWQHQADHTGAMIEFLAKPSLFDQSRMSPSQPESPLPLTSGVKPAVSTTVGTPRSWRSQ